MPNANISIYLTDEAYFKWTKEKTKLNSKVRENLKKLLGEKK